MNPLLSRIRTAAVLAASFFLLAGGVFPLVLWALSQIAFPRQANGSLIHTDQVVIGSRLIGQAFTDQRYFQPRPSAAGSGYDAAASGASNFGPANPRLLDDVQRLAAAYRAVNGLAESAAVPVDAVTRSGSGLDPHISVESARLQIARVARARGLDTTVVRALVRIHTEGPALGVLGERGVNVLLLNIALDSIR